MTAPLTAPTFPLDDADERLVERAADATRRAFDPDGFGGSHAVGAALRTTDGDVYTGVNVPSNVRRTSLCAEPIALGSALGDGARAFDAIVAVRHEDTTESGDPEVVPPCGACRELTADYGRDIETIVPRDGDLVKVRAVDLLPTRTW
ncbi:cytidine/deoxycytidylate deaminase family protein [Halocalculus aciditolerans]|uniref:Cytidine deaminase n=1 Tax=Halocalculus aciditolerans TaxID=1383812 RepID=A0A830FH43_9EURY|nr:cytidine deaminase [Halocalculus aciditolerans]GGL54724.1 cytidine deaminase [Halocalculus aciditolerans]